MNFFEKYVLPPAVKLGNQRHLLAIRDALVGMIAITMAGAFGTLLINLGQAVKGYDKIWESIFGPNWKMLGDDIWWGTLAFMTIFAVVGIAYKLARSYGDDGFEAMLVALACYFILVPKVATVTLTVDGKAVTGDAWGFIHWGYNNSTSLFSGIIVAIIATEIFVRLSKLEKLKIKLPDGVPPAVSRSFEKLFPGMLTILIVGIIGVVFRQFIADGAYFNDWISKMLVTPLQNAADSLPFAIGISFFIHFFWMLGLHGPNIIGGVTTPLFLGLGTENNDMYIQGVTELSKYNIMAGPFFDAFVFLGGAGASLGLLISMFIVSRKRHKQMLALGLPPGVFQINEPIIFGMPIVLNPIWAVPFVLTPIVLTITSYLSIQFGLVHPVTLATMPWVTPPILGGWLATGGHLSGALLAAVNLVISIVIYLPFVIAQNRIESKKLNKASEELTV